MEILKNRELRLKSESEKKSENRSLWFIEKRPSNHSTRPQKAGINFGFGHWAVGLVQSMSLRTWDITEIPSALVGEQDVRVPGLAVRDIKPINQTRAGYFSVDPEKKCQQAQEFSWEKNELRRIPAGFGS